MDAVTRFQLLSSGDDDLSSLNESTIEDWLELASEEHDASRFASDKGYQKAAVNLAAHRAKLALSDEFSGTPTMKTSQSAGDLSESYEAPDVSDQMDLTTYGQEYQRLLEKFVDRPYSV